MALAQQKVAGSCAQLRGIATALLRGSA